MLAAISYATAVNTNGTNIENKDSPLFGIRTQRAIREKIGEIMKNIKTKFIGERIFFVPFQQIRNKINRNSIMYRDYITEADTCQIFPKYCHTICMPFCDYTA